MHDSLSDLESQRDDLLKRLLTVGDCRPGSISSTSGPCGKPACRCHQPGQPGHGPHWRLTYKRNGKTVSESLPDAASRHKAAREIAAYREFQQLTRQLLDVNLTICRQRPAAPGTDQVPVQKKRSARSRTRSLSRSGAS